MDPRAPAARATLRQRILTGHGPTQASAYFCFLRHPLPESTADQKRAGELLPRTRPLQLEDAPEHEIDRHDVERRGLVERILDDADIERAVEHPPQTTRARLRGEFIRKAKERKRDYTVDWVHLKLNDQAQRTVLCKDPFKAYDDRVDKLIDSL